MKRSPVFRVFWFLAFVTLLLAPKCASRQTPDPPKPIPSARDGGMIENQYTKACAGLARAGCDEDVQQCAATLQRTVEDHVASPNLVCLANAQTKADVHSCGGFIRCP